jgi:multicomponent Na+:H+ antiporter subunit D
VNVLAPLAVAVPLSGAAIMLFLTFVLPRRVGQALALLVALAEVGIALALLRQADRGTLVYWFGGWTPRHGVALGVSFVVDPLAAGAAALAGVVVAAAVLATGRAVDEGSGIVHALLLTMLAAMAGFCLTGDLFNLFVFFELMAVSAFGLAAYKTESPAALRGALNFAITNSIGAFFVLIGIALIYARTGALNLAQISRQLTRAGRVDRLVVIALATIIIGFLIKAAVVPFHFWLIDAASTAPLPLAMILAGVLDTLGVYAVGRVGWTGFATPLAGHLGTVRALLIPLGAVSAVLGAALALASREPMRRLAFVLVSQTGILVIGVGCFTRQGIAGSAIYAVADGTVKAALFVGVAMLGAMRQGSDSDGTSHAQTAVWCSVATLALGGLALAGLPLFGTGLAKATIEDAATAIGYGWVTPVVVLASVLSGAAVLGIAMTAWRQATNHARSPSRWRASLGRAVASGGLLAVAAAAGLYLNRWAMLAAARFVDSAGYQRLVIAPGLNRHPTHAASVQFSVGGVALDLLAVAGAVALAAAIDHIRISPRGWRFAASTLGMFEAGSIGDSAAWVTVGAATIGLILALRLH